MDDVVGIAFAALFAVSIFILAGMFWQAQRNLRKLLNDPYKITPPFKAVYSDLKKGYYYIFVLHQHAFIRSSRRMMPNLDLINGMEFRARNLTEDKEIELEDFTGLYCMHFGGRKSTFGVYSVRFFPLHSQADVELQVSGGLSDDNNAKVFIFRSMSPGAARILVFASRMYLRLMTLGVLLVAMRYILEMLGVAMY